ncbi:hypothetical protein AAAC51_20825 [Priestia megaterium]
MAKSQQELISSMTDAELVKNLYVTQLLICFIALGIGFLHSIRGIPFAVFSAGLVFYFIVRRRNGSLCSRRRYTSNEMRT